LRLTHEGAWTGRGVKHATEIDSAQTRALERDAWHEELRSAIGNTSASDADKEAAFAYWTGEYQLEFNESGDRCIDQRARALLQRLLTPERVLELTKLVKEKLATGLDEFNLVLVKQGGLELAKLFADACAEEVAAFYFPTSWTTWHATLIPKPGNLGSMQAQRLARDLDSVAQVEVGGRCHPSRVRRGFRAHGSSCTCGCGSLSTSTFKTTPSSSRRFRGISSPSSCTSWASAPSPCRSCARCRTRFSNCL